MSTTRQSSTATDERRPGSWLRNRSVRTKLLGLILLLATITAGSGTYAVLSLRAAAADSQELATITSQIVGTRVQIQERQAQARLVVAQLAALDDPADEAQWLVEQADNDDAMAAAMETYGASAAAVDSSSIDALAVASPVRSVTIVWKLMSASRRPCEISGWYGV